MFSTLPTRQRCAVPPAQVPPTSQFRNFAVRNLLQPKWRNRSRPATGCDQLPHGPVLTYFFPLACSPLPLSLCSLDSSLLCYLCQSPHLMVSLSCHHGLRYVLSAAHMLTSSVPIDIRTP